MTELRFPATTGSASPNSVVDSQHVDDHEFAAAASRCWHRWPYIGASIGAPSAFVEQASGGFGDVTWITGFDTMADVDAFDEWQMTDTGYDALRRVVRGEQRPHEPDRETELPGRNS